MWRISVEQAKGGMVQLAPWGTASDPLPCLVWADTSEKALARKCLVEDPSGAIVTGDTRQALRASAIRYGLKVSDDPYLP